MFPQSRVRAKARSYAVNSIGPGFFIRGEKLAAFSSGQRQNGSGHPKQRAETEAKPPAAKQFGAPIVTEVTEAVMFYPAEDYHQGYFDQNPNQPYCQFVVAPKVVKARAKYAARFKT